MKWPCITPDHGSPEQGYGSEYDNKQYLKTQVRKKNQLMKQFCKLESGVGNSEAFVRNYELIDWTK